MWKNQGRIVALLACLMLFGATQLSAQESNGPPWGTFTVYGYGSEDGALADAEDAMERRLEELANEIPPGFSIGKIEITTSEYSSPCHVIIFRVWLTLGLADQP